MSDGLQKLAAFGRQHGDAVRRQVDLPTHVNPLVDCGDLAVRRPVPAVDLPAGTQVVWVRQVNGYDAVGGQSPGEEVQDDPGLGDGSSFDQLPEGVKFFEGARTCFSPGCPAEAATSKPDLGIAPDDLELSVGRDKDGRDDGQVEVVVGVLVESRTEEAEPKIELELGLDLEGPSLPVLSDAPVPEVFLLL